MAVGQVKAHHAVDRRLRREELPCEFQMKIIHEGTLMFFGVQPGLPRWKIDLDWIVIRVVVFNQGFKDIRQVSLDPISVAFFDDRPGDVQVFVGHVPQNPRILFVL